MGQSSGPKGEKDFGFQYQLWMKSVKQPPFFRSPGSTQRQTAKVSNIPTKSLWSQDLISDSTRDIYEQLNNGGKCGDSVDGRGMPVCAYFQLNAKFTSNV